VRRRLWGAAAALLALTAGPGWPAAGRGYRYDFSGHDVVTSRGAPDASVALAPPHPALGFQPRVPDVGHTDEYQGVDVVIEAPWRVLVRDGPPATSYVPLLFFIPDARYPDLVDGFDPVLLGQRVRGITAVGPLQRGHLRLREAVVSLPAERDRIVYRESTYPPPAAPVTPMVVVDEMGGVRPRLLDAPFVSADKNEGWHRILRIPVAELRPALGPDPVAVELEARLVYDRHYDNSGTGDFVDRVTHRKRLRVTLSRHPLPSPGEGWIALDPHHHTVAEYTRQNYPTAPRKAFGSPLQMMKEALYALGMTETLPAGQRLASDHPVLATDHNTFFDDGDTIMVGPSSASAPVAAAYPSAADFAAAVAGGRAEFERMRAVLGDGAGQEVTLKGARLGHHVLAYRTRHFTGAWHGGCLNVDGLVALLKTAFHFVKESADCSPPKRPADHNENTLERVLAGIAGSPHFPGGFAYASHPFNCGIPWSPEMLRTALFDPTDRFVRDPRRWQGAGPRELVFKGLQVWNSRATYLIEGRINFKTDIDFYDLNPFGRSGWKPIRPHPSAADADETLPCSADETGADPWWELRRGLLHWHRLVRTGLTFRLGNEGDVALIRKVYIVAGTDAHGRRASNRGASWPI
jgi:hypothetical protein